eukprot:4209739-Pleurochrysis_carterae.AAC.1
MTAAAEPTTMSMVRQIGDFVRTREHLKSPMSTLKSLSGHGSHSLLWSGRSKSTLKTGCMPGAHARVLSTVRSSFSEQVVRERERGRAHVWAMKGASARVFMYPSACARARVRARARARARA